MSNWEKNWELKSLSFDELKNVIVEVVAKQLDEIANDTYSSSY
jgi:hypothetical protein